MKKVNLKELKRVWTLLIFYRGHNCSITNFIKIINLIIFIFFKASATIRAYSNFFFWFQGFRDTSTEVQVMSFSAWNILIDNFALSPGNVSMYIIFFKLFCQDPKLTFWPKVVV